ncbi:hypothetical protein RhiLY_13171 [Ceratobasidium sp. AG-Ba]|nr:hypothetical protein RhiLY_13171 [Ceratobasidium sp. AG-Ba]
MAVEAGIYHIYCLENDQQQHFYPGQPGNPLMCGPQPGKGVPLEVIHLHGDTYTIKSSGFPIGVNGGFGSGVPLEVDAQHVEWDITPARNGCYNIKYGKDDLLWSRLSGPPVPLPVVLEPSQGESRQQWHFERAEE